MVVEIKRRYGPDHIDFRRPGHGGIISRLGAELPGKNSLPQRSNVPSAGPLFGMEECDMAANRTQRYGLHLWEPGDDFLREEFNENFEALDAVPEAVTGTYTGDGTGSQFIALGFTPKAVLAGARGSLGAGGGGLTLPGHPCYEVSHGVKVLEAAEGGFYAFKDSWGSANDSGSAYHYLAVR